MLTKAQKTERDRYLRKLLGPHFYQGYYHDISAKAAAGSSLGEEKRSLKKIKRSEEYSSNFRRG